MQKIPVLILLIVLFTTPSRSQLNEKNASSTVRQQLKKLNVLESVLYIAAHPDDENTRLISYLSNETLSRTAYLSLTRGDGGQNLIGTEKGEKLGLIRTQELLEARKIDGGEQFFTRAIDFGYSKSADESFEFWGKENVLHDVVLVIRQFQPDVIVTRFPPNKRAGHGHHTASAMLAEEAFKAAADPNKFPKQLSTYGVSVWQTKRLYFNASSWWDSNIAELAKESDEYVTVNIGTYNSNLGVSYGEMAAESRSMHKSQGFGSARQRGEKIEYLQHKLGSKALNNNLFSGLEKSWKSQGKAGEKIDELLQQALAEYNVDQPTKIISKLIEVKKTLLEIEGPFKKWAQIKSKDLDQLILSLMGVYFEITAPNAISSRGEKVELNVRAINRSDIPVMLKSITINNKTVDISKTLDNNLLNDIKKEWSITSEMPYSNPYWLNTPSKGRYKVENEALIGKPEFNAYDVTFSFQLNNIEIMANKPIEYRWVDREKGELYRPFVVLPKATISISDPVFIFSNEQVKTISVKLKGNAGALSGKVILSSGKGWKIEPAHIEFSTTQKGEEQTFSFMVTPPKNADQAQLKASVHLTDLTLSKSVQFIEYDHITTQHLAQEATSKLIKLDLTKTGNEIGYIKGAGDDVPQSLEQIGYNVTILNPDELNLYDLSKFKAIICGIRAYNVNKKLQHAKPALMKYVQSGGNLIVQYQTNRGVNTNHFSPYSITLSRDRVTKEEASVNFLASKHPILNTPNKITQTDFEGWVQERGLYFASEWSKEFTPLLSWNDPGESPKKGSLMVANYGEGAFIYTGISFFRQLPAGIPGAYRLLTNIISYQNKQQP